MPAHKTIKRIGHRWDDLFHLVLDIEKYPAFVPHCRGVRLLSRKVDGSSTIILSRMQVGLSALQVGYDNRTIGNLQARRIDIEAREWPLRYLRAVWTFSPCGDNCTDIEFFVNYEFDSSLLAIIARRAFRSMFDDIVDAFERRADHVFPRMTAPADGATVGAARSMARQRVITTF